MSGAAGGQPVNNDHLQTMSQTVSQLNPFENTIVTAGKGGVRGFFMDATGILSLDDIGNPNGSHVPVAGESHGSGGFSSAGAEASYVANLTASRASVGNGRAP